MSWANKLNTCPHCQSTEYKEIGQWNTDLTFCRQCVCSGCDKEFTIPYLLVFDEDRWLEQYD